MTKFVQTVRANGKTYNYFRAGGDLKRNRFPRLRLSDDPEKALEQANLLRGLSVEAAHGDLKDAIAVLVQEGRRRARKKELRFDLTEDEVFALIKMQGYKCALSGLEFDLQNRGDRDDAFRRPFAPSLDRIVPRDGYTINNVRIVCCALNLALNEFGAETFIKIARAVAEKHPA